MKDELILKILDKASEIMDTETASTLRDILYQELHGYDVTPEVRALVPVTKAPELLRYYLASKKLDGLSDATLKSYKRYLVKFLMAIGKEVEDITTEDCRAWLAAYMCTGVKKSTMNTIRGALKSFFSWMIENKRMQWDPMLPIKASKTEKHVRKPLDADELESLRYASKDDPRDRAMVEFFFSTGCRLDEVCKLNRNDINWQSKDLFVFGKGSKERKVYISPSAKMYLQKYLSLRTDKNEALFVAVRAPHKRIGRRAIQRIFNKLGYDAEINRSVHPHLMRHTAATHMLQADIPISIVQRMLGHSTAATTEIYARTNDDMVRQAHRKAM